MEPSLQSSTVIPQAIQNQIEEALKSLDSPRELSALTELLALNIFQQNVNLPPYENLRIVFSDVLTELRNINPDYANLLEGRRWQKLSVEEMIQKRRPQQWSASQFYKIQSNATDEFVTLLWQRELDIRKNQPEKPKFTLPAAQPISGIPFTITRAVIYPALAIIILVIIYIGSKQSMAISVSQTATAAASLASTSATTLMPSQSIQTAVPVETSSIAQASPTPQTFCGEDNLIPVDGSVYRFIRSQGLSEFTPENTPGILSPKIRSLVIDRTGLWMGYFTTDNFSDGGLGHFDKKGKIISNCNRPGITGDQNVNTVTVDQTGRVWVGMEKGGIAVWDGSVWRLYTTADGLPSDWIYSLYVDSQNRIWAGTWEGVALFENGRWSTPYTFTNGTLFDNKVHAVALDAKQNIWIGHIDKGMSYFDAAAQKWSHFTRESGELAGDSVRAIVTQNFTNGKSQAVWVALLDGGLSRYQDGQWTSFTSKNGLPADEVRTVAVDMYNRVWAATSKGVSYYDGVAWRRYDTLDTISLAFGVDCPDNTCSINADNIFTGTMNAGLTHSRLPLPEDGLEVVKVCFMTMDRHEICPDPTVDSSAHVVLANYPQTLKPGDQFYLEVTVNPLSPNQLLESRGDMLVNNDVDDTNLFGAFERIPVKGSIDSGQSFTFVDFNNPMTAPALEDNVKEQTFFSNWRVWMYNRYLDPAVRISFTVKK
jgi:hypothetical protein